MIEQRMVQVGGHELAVVAANEHLEGPAIVFLHGILCSVNFWEPTFPAALGDSMRWYSISLPGHWPSRMPPHLSKASFTEEGLAELMLQAIESQVGHHSAALVGWSTGGFLALNLAATYGDRFNQVLTISGFFDGRWRGLMGTLQKWSRGGPVTRQLFRQIVWSAQRSYAVFRLAARLTAADGASFRKSHVGRKTLKTMYPDFKRHDRSALSFVFNRTRELDIADRLDSIRCPTTIAGGTKDPIIRFDHTRQLAAAIADSTLVPLDGCGHAFFAERAEQYQQLLCGWLSELDVNCTCSTEGPP